MIAFLFSVLLFVAGFVLFDLAFAAPGYEALLFASGLLLASLAFALPLTIYPLFRGSNK